MKSGRTKLAALALLACACAATGCANKVQRVAGSGNPPAVPAPARTTAIGAVRFLEWALERRDVAAYRTLFTEGFYFYFDPADSSGNVFRSDPWGREKELRSALHLLQTGNLLEPPASAVTLDYGSVLREIDTGDTLDQATHRQVSTVILLEIDAGQARFTVQGAVDLYLVHRRDAKIPADIASRVGANDWLIYAWVDRTLSPAPLGALAPMPASKTTWGRIKALYL